MTRAGVRDDGQPLTFIRGRAPPAGATPVSLVEIGAPPALEADARPLPRGVGLLLGAGISLAMWLGLAQLARVILGV